MTHECGTCGARDAIGVERCGIDTCSLACHGEHLLTCRDPRCKAALAWARLMIAEQARRN